MKKILPEITLGTVQLGMNYGIANFDGKPDKQKSFEILKTAFENGATSIDTARAYGDSELVIGEFLKTWKGKMPYITTKVKLANDPSIDIEKHTLTSVEQSLERLGVDKVDCILVHSPVDMFHHGQKLADAMEKVQKLGYTDKIGVSIYTYEDITEMMKYPAYRATQIPMSIFDTRLITSGAVDMLKNADYTVFVRSVFLQGLFFLDPDTITDEILVKYAKPKIEALGRIAKAEGLSIASLAIAFIRDTVGVSSLVLGADSPEQVMDNISCFDAPTLSPDVMETIKKEFSHVDIPEIMKVLSRPKQ